ncbi:MAG: hypothetical protein QOJ09_2641 [Actinomycetota bacterium]|nr:hypothetical protein [Actinomycetota bacterium]
MPAAGVLLLAVAAVAYILRASLRRAFVCFLGVWMFVPGTLVVPNGFTSYLTMVRIVLVVFLASLAARAARGEIPTRVFRPTPLHAVFAVFLVVTFVNGVATSTGLNPLGGAYREWIRLLDQALFLVATLAALRAIGDTRWVARVVAGMLVGLLGIALLERLTGISWAQWFFHGLREQRVSPPAFGLERRGGTGPVRVRASTAFALEFAWLCATLLPLLIVVVARSRRRVTLLVLPLFGAVIVWTNARSVFLGLGAGAIVLLLTAARDRRVVQIAGAGLALGLLVALSYPGLRSEFAGKPQQGSVEVRHSRIALTSELAAHRPWQGLGFGGLKQLGVATTDFTYLLLYAEVGVLGLAVFVILGMTALASAAAGLRGPPSADRALAAAATAGVLTALIGAGAFDLLQRPAASGALWLMTALGIVVAERSGPTPWPRPTRVGAALPAVGAAMGLGLFALAPSHAVTHLVYETRSPASLSVQEGFPLYVNNVLSKTTCSLLAGAEDGWPDARLECEPLLQGSDAGRIRVEAHTIGAVRTVSQSATRFVKAQIPSFATHTEPIERGKPTWARTAPLWLSIAGLAVWLLVPLRRRRVKDGSTAR